MQYSGLTITEQHKSCCYCCVGAVRFIQAWFGPGDGPIHLDVLRCSGDEERLENCPSNGVGVHNCIHREDAGVRCMAGIICR